MRWLILFPFLLAACGKATALPEPASAPRFVGEISSARSGGAFAGEVLTASSKASGVPP